MTQATNQIINVVYLQDVGYKVYMTYTGVDLESYGETLSEALTDLTEQIENIEGM